MNGPRNAPIVLFVDDEQLARKYFERAFGKELNVKTAGSAEEAREFLHKHGQDVAIVMSDQRMPAGDGVSLLSEVKEHYPHAIRLLTTAYTEIDDAVAAVNRGEVWRYITKPWQLENLRAELNAAMEVYRYRVYEQALLQERRRSMLLVASHIAHEMRTPLRSIHAATTGIERYLPRLLDAYEKAQEAGLDVQPISEHHRGALRGSTESIRRVVDRSNAMIDLLLANCGAHEIDRSDFQVVSMRDCVESALQDYPFTDRERQLVSWEGGPDFHFLGSSNLMVFVINNLLRNALRAVAAAGAGGVRLWTDIEADTPVLHIRDTGTGIEPKIMPKIFDDFTSFADDDGAGGVGIGLGFCRRVVSAFGGHIDCDSEPGSYTQFDLWLPAARGESVNDRVGTGK
ncbi:hybrid sensor histidine kinase/response regulator [Ectothiorhodospiraceae bacterium WFHF3C12]|nr:hybrid sensor histidine kinase/response regulator [Ectothiorhodospiraceae bacterium WFHF3C12]